LRGPLVVPMISFAKELELTVRKSCAAASHQLLTGADRARVVMMLPDMENGVDELPASSSRLTFKPRSGLNSSAEFLRRMSSKLDAGGGVEKFSIDELAGGGRSIEVAGRGRSGRMKVARCGWGRTGAGEVDAGMPVSRCTVSLNSMVLASSTVVGTRFVARERRFEGFVGPRARDDDTRDGSGAGDCSAEVEGGSDVRHVWSVSTSEKREGLAGASTGAVRCIASWLLCELDDGNGEL
jgi:hypothetical protein